MELAEAISIFFLSTVKFFFAPGVCVAAGFNLIQTILITASGGMFGITVFYYFGRWIHETISYYRSKKRKPKKIKKVFTRRNKTIVKIKWKFGLIGLAILTPAILSIPIGCVVASKFYYNNRLTYPLLLFSTAVWATGLSVFAHSVKTAIV